MKIKSINPYTEEVNWTYNAFSIGECRTQIKNSRAAFSGWSSLPAEERAKYFTRVGEVLRQNAETYAGIITKEMGKPIRQSRRRSSKMRQALRLLRRKCSWIIEETKLWMSGLRKAM